MPTPWFSEYIEAVGSGGTLLLGSRAIGPGNHQDLHRVGRSVGGNTRVGESAGRLPRARSSDDLTVPITDVLLDGAYDQDNAAVAAAAQRGQLLTLMRTVANFWDDSCTGRQFTLRLTEGSDVWEGIAHFEDIGAFRPVGNSTIALEVSLLVTIAAGRLELVAP